jgi:hypothetical protein
MLLQGVLQKDAKVGREESKPETKRHSVCALTRVAYIVAYKWQFNGGKEGKTATCSPLLF